MRGDEHGVGQLGQPPACRPGLDGLAAFFLRAGFVGMGAQDKERLGVEVDQLQYLVEPGEHIGEDGVGMHLAGIEDHVGEHRDELLELGQSAQKGLVQAAHLGPEADASHAEVALEALFQVSVQAGVFCLVQLEVRGDIHWIGGGFARREEGRVRAQAHLVRDAGDAAGQRQAAGDRFGIEHAVECDQQAGVVLIQKGGEFLGHALRREDVLAQQEAGRCIVVQGMAAQHPAQGGEDDLAEGEIVSGCGRSSSEWIVDSG